MPGGVNSPVRAFKSVGRDPLYIERAKGAHRVRYFARRRARDIEHHREKRLVPCEHRAPELGELARFTALIVRERRGRIERRRSRNVLGLEPRKHTRLRVSRFEELARHWARDVVR